MHIALIELQPELLADNILRGLGIHTGQSLCGHVPIRSHGDTSVGRMLDVRPCASSSFFVNSGENTSVLSP
jgi:hypothetical protein